MISEHIQTVLSDGRLVARDNSMWLARTIPLTPIVDALTDQARVDASATISRIVQELANLTKTTGTRRSFNSDNYREIQLHWVNLPSAYQPNRNMVNATNLADDFGHLTVFHRQLVVLIRLKPSILATGKNPIRAVIDSVTEAFVSGTIPLDEYTHDYENVKLALERAGASHPPTASERNYARAWWNAGKTADTPYLLHTDHVHAFATVHASQHAKNLADNDVPCTDWDIPNSGAFTFVEVSDIDLPYVDARTLDSLWFLDFINSGARVVSIRGRIEPAKITRGELARNRDTFQREINERYSQNKSSKAEMEKQTAELDSIERSYAQDGGQPTLTNLRITVGYEGIHSDAASIMPSSRISLAGLAGHMQEQAWSETLPLSPVRVNGHAQDLPVTAISASGIMSLSTVGNQEGALVGLTETDRQPAYMASNLAAEKDAYPFTFFGGATGSGKSMMMLHLARQWAQIVTPNGEKTPVCVVDYKPHSDFSDGVLAAGGRVISLDDLLSADGVFDPLRCMNDKAEAIDTAAAMLFSINPWGAGKEGFELDLLEAIKRGVDNGATCLGEAFEIANSIRPVNPDLVGPLYRLAETSPTFRGLFGMQRGGNSLASLSGLTLIKSGSVTLTLPNEGEKTPFIAQRINQWILRMTVHGIGAAFTNRYGMILLDEAWQFVQNEDGAKEIARVGRMARSMFYQVGLASQRIDEFIEAKLSGYFAQALILNLDRGTGETNPKTLAVDTGQAGQALRLFKVPATEERLHRMAASRFLPGSEEPNWESLHALRDTTTGKVIRGSVAYYIDVSGHVVPVEIIIPGDYLARISTRASDVRARDKTASPPAVVDSQEPGGVQGGQLAWLKPVASQ